jgi:GWxTD domain-containing protein
MTTVQQCSFLNAVYRKMNGIVCFRSALCVSFVFGVLELFGGTPRDIVVQVLQFKQSPTTNIVEVQYSFSDNSVVVELTPDGYLGYLNGEIIVETEGKLSPPLTWFSLVQRKQRAAQSVSFYTGFQRLEIPHGNHTMMFRFSDSLAPSEVYLKSFALTVEPFPNSISMSDAFLFQPKNQLSAQLPELMRNGTFIEPNPRNEVVGADPIAGVCFELYNAKTFGLTQLSVALQVVDNVDREVFSEFIPIEITSDALMFNYGMSCIGVASGVYSLKVRVMDADRKKSYCSKSCKFYLLNPTEPIKSQDFAAEDDQFFLSEWSSMSEERTELELQLISIIASGAEREKASTLKDNRTKQRFLFNFWRIRDPNTETAINERYDDFKKMYERAQKFFTPGTTGQGWKTDRGTILMRYGVPTQVNLFNQAIDTKPYEEWFYQNVQGGVYFYFVDWQLNNTFPLVHSTMFGQIRDENWFNRWAKAYSPDPNPVRMNGN